MSMIDDGDYECQSSTRFDLVHSMCPSPMLFISWGAFDAVVEDRRVGTRLPNDDWLSILHLTYYEHC